ncbi:unnamed protein product, partial [marine sediment metagenome]
KEATEAIREALRIHDIWSPRSGYYRRPILVS